VKTVTSFPANNSVHKHQTKVNIPGRVLVVNWENVGVFDALVKSKPLALGIV